MPCFNLPFILKTDFTKGHSICSILPILQNQKIITASTSGELIIWEMKDVESLEPRLYLTPSPNLDLIKFSCMTLIRKPLAYYTVIIFYIL
jgi:hypothetical protein